MKTIQKTVVQLIFACLLSLTAMANNIEVNNISLENLNETEGWVNVEFDLSWENSWRLSAGPANWDAAWVFVKFRANNGEWQHASLANSDFTAPAGSTLQISPDNVGAMIYRDSNGSGDVAFANTQLRWNYGSVSTSDILDVQVFAIEMVYVPEGAFWVGGTNGDEAFKFYRGGFGTTASYNVVSEGAITVANSGGNLYYDGEGDQSGPIPASFPKGFGAFYSMKYEVTQDQWIGFFNTLNETQKIERDITGPNGKNIDGEIFRNGVSWTGGASAATTTFPYVAMNYLGVADINAYFDWSGLRYMTELEYEKSCRGPVLPKPGEFAWGNANIATTQYNIINSGAENEQLSNPEQSVGNANYSVTDGSNDGPLRNGIFASSAITNNREETGGSYYGIMELTGNVYERCVTVGDTTGRSYSGLHGDGSIDASGNGNVVNWLDRISGEGTAFRGASWINSAPRTRVSDRANADDTVPLGNQRLGARGVRTDF